MVMLKVNYPKMPSFYGRTRVIHPHEKRDFLILQILTYGKMVGFATIYNGKTHVISIMIPSNSWRDLVTPPDPLANRTDLRSPTHLLIRNVLQISVNIFSTQVLS